MNRITPPAAGRAPEAAAAQIAAWCHAPGAADWPRSVRETAQLCVIDALSSILTCDIAERSGMAWHAVSGGQDAPAGPCTVVGTRLRAQADAAAFVNATSAASTSRSDTFAESATHPGMTVIPAVLAVAEQRNAPLGQALAAVVVGYETMAQLARALVVPETSSRFRPSGLVGAVAAAAGCCHALGLDAGRTQHAISIAAQMLSGLNQWAREGTTDHMHHIATAASNGVRAAFLAEAGATAPAAILEGQSGLLAAFGLRDREPLLLAGLGAGPAILGAAFKPAPVCMYAQAPVQAASRLVRGRALSPDEVVDVEVRTCRMGADYPGCDNAGPIAEYQSAKQSIQFSVACVLASGGVRDENWLDFTNPAFNALAGKTRVVVDDGYTAAFPARLGISIAVRLRDGTVLDIAQDDMDPMGGEEIVERFRRVAEGRIGAANADAVVEALMGHATTDTAPFMALLTRPWSFPNVRSRT